jgi:hypothetical protein
MVEDGKGTGEHELTSSPLSRAADDKRDRRAAATCSHGISISRLMHAHDARPREKSRIVNPAGVIIHQAISPPRTNRRRTACPPQLATSGLWV